MKRQTDFKSKIWKEFIHFKHSFLELIKEAEERGNVDEMLWYRMMQVSKDIDNLQVDLALMLPPIETKEEYRYLFKEGKQEHLK